MDNAELEALLSDLESDRVERKESASDGTRIREAICAFANDMPGHNEPGVVFVGVKDDGSNAGLEITDRLLLDLANMRDDGNILPIPMMTVAKRELVGSDVAVIIVEPDDAPPVRFKGRIRIRVGPRRAIASAADERRLNEKRRYRDLHFDLRPIQSASRDDLDMDLFERTYLPSAVASDVLAENQRSTDQQMASVRFVSSEDSTVPTVVGLLTIGRSPADQLPGAYVQFLRLDGVSLTDPISDQKECHGPLPQLLQQLDDLLKANIHVATDITTRATEMQSPDYPIVALQQFIRNAVMHRDYETSNAPIRVTWFSDRIEIQNPGGPYGQVTRANFGQPGITDYRNPAVAEAMRNLGYVQRFGVGIQTANSALDENGNPRAEFQVEDNHVLVMVRKCS